VPERCVFFHEFLRIKMKIRDRNLGIRKVRVADLEDAPWNFRTHPQPQKEALAGVVSELGWYGYPDVYETPDGLLRIADGHLRKALLIERYGPDTEIEVNVTDFDEADARKATLTKDPLAAMAEADAAKLDALLREVQTSEPAVSAMLAELAAETGIIPPDFQPVGIDEQGRLDEKAKVKCPECGHEF